MKHHEYIPCDVLDLTEVRERRWPYQAQVGVPRTTEPQQSDWTECMRGVSLVATVMLMLGVHPMTSLAVSELTIEVANFSKAVALGATGELTVKTEAGALCVGKTWSETKPTERMQFSAQSADQQGQVTWAWTIPRTGPTGRWSIDLQCAATEKKGRISLGFEVR